MSDLTYSMKEMRKCSFSLWRFKIYKLLLQDLNIGTPLILDVF